MRLHISLFAVGSIMMLLMTATVCAGEGGGPLLLGMVQLKYSSGDARLDSAKVELFDHDSKATKAEYSTYTNSRGIFGFYDVPPGSYLLRISLGGEVLSQKPGNSGDLVKTQRVEIGEPGKKIRITVVKEVNTRGFGATPHRIIAMHSDKCIDIKGKATKDGAKAQQWPCTGGENQLFNIVPKGDGYYIIVAKHSDKCLDVKGKKMKDGAVVQQWPCTGGENQHFSIVPKDDNFYSIVARHSGKCLDVKGKSAKKGVKIQQWSCNGGENQAWKLQ